MCQGHSGISKVGITDSSEVNEFAARAGVKGVEFVGAPAQENEREQRSIKKCEYTPRRRRRFPANKHCVSQIVTKSHHLFLVAFVPIFTFHVCTYCPWYSCLRSAASAVARTVCPFRVTLLRILHMFQPNSNIYFVHFSESL